MGKRISRVLSLSLLHEAEDQKADHFSRTPIARHLWQPTRDSRRTCVIGAGRASSLIWPCSEWGLPCHRCYQQTRGSLTPPFHPCLCSHSKVEPSAVCSLLHFPSRCHARPLAGTLPFGARTFLEWAGIAATRDPHSLPRFFKHRDSYSSSAAIIPSPTGHSPVGVHGPGGSVRLSGLEPETS